MKQDYQGLVVQVLALSLQSIKKLVDKCEQLQESFFQIKSR